jgi:ABC-type bacteriocin/lantibiotic exporter with double-glycine peptidase domain
MKPFPHYLQLDAMDCGPTCLRMIAAHYGQRYSLETLREKSHISREGNVGDLRNSKGEGVKELFFNLFKSLQNFSF